jgi:hypothetical protein
MGWRNQDAGIGATVVFNGKGDTADDVRKFSMDNLVISGVPNAPYGGMDTVAAHFTDGNDDTTYVDAYHGIAGNGWRTPWSDQSTGAPVTNHRVVMPGDLDFNEVKTGGGAYLSFSSEDQGGGSTASVARNYRTTADPGIDWSQKHTIEFTVRIDEDVDDELLFTDDQDKYAIFDCSYAATETNPNNTWQITAKPTGDLAGNWGVHDGSTSDMVSTGIALTTGGVYDFTIVVDPTNQSYDATISDGTSTYDSTVLHPDGLLWRSSATEIGGYLCFAARNSDLDDTRAFSLDGLVITQNLQPIPGDTDGNNIVNEVDAQTLATNWGASVTPGDYESGDFSGDGVVGPADAAILAANWGYGTTSEASPIPEPVSAALLLVVGMVAAVARRSRQ